MQIAHQALQPLIHDMRIDLRRRNVGVAQQGLDHPQISAVMEKMTGEGMAQHMRADETRRQSGDRRKRFQVARKMLPGEMPAFAEGGKQPFGRGSPGIRS